MCGRRGWPACVRPLGDSLIDIRDRAVLLIGYAGAFRRSELVGLDVEDIAEVEDGLRITLVGDQEGEGIVIGIPYGSNPVTCPGRRGRSRRSSAALGNGIPPRPVPAAAAAPAPRFPAAPGATVS